MLFKTNLDGVCVCEVITIVTNNHVYIKYMKVQRAIVKEVWNIIWNKKKKIYKIM